MEKKTYIKPDLRVIQHETEEPCLAAISILQKISHKKKNGSSSITVDDYEDGGEDELYFGTNSSNNTNKLSDNFWMIVAFILTLFLPSSCTNDSSITSDESGGIHFRINMSRYWANNALPVKKAQGESQDAAPQYGRNLKMTSSNGTIAYLCETNTNGIERDLEKNIQLLNGKSNDTHRSAALNPKRAQKVTSASGMSNDGFSTFCYYGTNNELYYSNVQSDKEGILAQDKEWPINQPLRFYAIHPYDGTAARFGGNASGITYNYTLPTNVENQQDLLYASSDVLAYREDCIAPLNFRHALAAIEFSLGSEPNFGVNITSLAIKNVNTQGTLTLPSTATSGESPAAATWSNLGTTGNISLTGLNVETDGHPNMAITTGNKTFMALPCSDLSGVVIEIGFSDGTTMNTTLTSGEWRAGYTYTYKLSKQEETFTYTLQTYGNYTNSGWGALLYNENETWNVCAVKSYKTSNQTGIQSAVPWEVAEYEYSNDAGATWTSTGTIYPSWLADFPNEESGSTSWQAFYPEVIPDELTTESTSARDLIIQNGTQRTNYDLSTHDIKGNTIARSTANCYIVSGPGTYKFPLVYGNAITNGATNTESYHPTLSGTADFARLQDFLNYNGTAITNPWIKTDGTPTSAKLIWADSPSLYKLLNDNVSIDGDYLCFDASVDTLLRAGNAILAACDASGNVMWSWHIWFAPDNVLDEIPVLNAKENTTFTFSTEPIGYRTGNTFGTSYSEERIIRVRVVQKEGNAGDIKQGYIYIGQEPYTQNIPSQYSTFQWGRKDAFPGSNFYWPSTGYNYNGSGPVDYATSIKNPGIKYTNSSANWTTTVYGNAWTGQGFKAVFANDLVSYGDLVVNKTVYDPSPAGFKVPHHTGIIAVTYDTNTNNYNVNPSGHSNISGSWNSGFSFYTNPNTKNATIFFPALGKWDSSFSTSESFYWSANPYGSGTAGILKVTQTQLFGYNTAKNHTCGHAVFPVKE